jgi:hypothetical protein
MNVYIRSISEGEESEELFAKEKDERECKTRKEERQT